MQTIVEIQAINKETGFVHCFRGVDLKEALCKAADYCAENPKTVIPPLTKDIVKISYNWDMDQMSRKELDDFTDKIVNEAQVRLSNRQKKIDNLFFEFKTKADNIGLTTELISVSDRFFNNRIITKKP